jgi:uncharacterized membrane protein
MGALVGIGLAQLAISTEGSVHLPSELTYTPATATAVLSAIVGAMVGLTGFVVTIGVLIVQMASQSLSPRYMRLWYRDRLQKGVLALFIGTLAFSFGLLRNVSAHSAPNLGVSAAGFAVTLGLVLFIIYLDRFVHRLRPVAVSALVGRAGQTVFTREAAIFSAGADADLRAIAVGAPVVVACSERGGTIQAVDLGGLLAAAERCDGLMVLVQAVGDFVPRGAALVEVFCNGQAPSEKALRSMVALGDERTIDQDPAFALRIIVDIALMALSPAVNAPTTAVQVLDNIEEFLQCVGVQPLDPIGIIEDRSGRTRVAVPRRSWSEYLALGVTEIREYGETSTQVARRLRAALESLASAVEPARREAVREQLGKLDAALAEAIADPSRRAFAAEADPQGIGGVPRLKGVSQPAEDGLLTLAERRRSIRVDRQ